MKYEKILGTDMLAGKIVLGTDRFGSEVSREDSFALMDYFFENGGNLFDTAHIYADWASDIKSVSEKTVGAWIKARGNRHKVLISTKGGHPNLDSMNVSRLSRTEILSDLEGSLSALGTDYADIYWLHRDDESIPVGALCEVLNEILASGKARAVGVSNWTCERINRANEYAERNGLQKIRLSQLQYSLAFANSESVPSDIRVMTDEEYKMYVRAQYQVFAFSSQAKGFFGIMEKVGEAALPDSVRRVYENQRNIELFSRVKACSVKKGAPCSATALAALVDDTKLSCFALVSTNKLSRLAEVLQYADLSVSEKERNELLR